VLVDAVDVLLAVSCDCCDGVVRVVMVVGF
jgi:hypothetical protein